MNTDIDAYIAIELDDFHRLRHMHAGHWSLEKSRWNYVKGDLDWYSLADDREPLYLTSIYLGLIVGRKGCDKPQEIRERLHQLNTELTTIIWRHLASQV